MATISIMCDASHHTVLKIGGYSGVVHIQDGENQWSEDYEGLSIESIDSNEAEMLAIAAGFRKAGKIIRKEKLSVDGLFAYTDSVSSINQFEAFMSNAPTHKKYRNTLSEMKKSVPKINGDGSPIVKHVKGHVKAIYASPLEKMHNIIDKRAVNVRKKAQNHLFKPNTTGSKHYGVSLPGKPRAWQIEEFKQLGYSHAKDGLIARISITGKLDDQNKMDDGTVHPYIAGVELAAKEMGVNSKNLYEIKRFSKNGGLYNSSQGFDRTMIRHYLNKNNLSIPALGLNLAPHQFAGVASRLIYGQQHPNQFNEHNLTGRAEPPSKFVLNLFEGNNVKKEPFYTGEWLDEFMVDVNVPYRKGLRQAMEQLELNPLNRLPDPDYELKGMVKSVVAENYDVLEPKQIINCIIKEMNSLGYSNLDDRRGVLVKMAKKNIVSEDDMIDKFTKSLINAVYSDRAITTEFLPEIDVRNDAVELSQKKTLSITPSRA